MHSIADDVKRIFAQVHPEAEDDTFTIQAHADLGFEDFFLISIDHKDSQGFVSWAFVIVSDGEIRQIAHYQEGELTCLTWREE